MKQTVMGGPSDRQAIQAALNTTGHARYSPTAIEAFMRLKHPTLDGLSPAAFRREVEIARACIDASTPAEVEALVASFGFTAQHGKESK